MSVQGRAAERPARLEQAALYALFAFAVSIQFSIAAASILLSLTGVLWLAVVLSGRERPEAPPMFWPLAVYAGLTLAASLFSIDPRASLVDSKQLVLLLIVPIVYRLARGERAATMVDVIITVGAINAAVGIFQFSLLGFDSLERRPQGNLMYMTYSGLIMLVACTAVARLLFRTRDRAWTALVMPAIIVALVTTSSRNAWVGACAGIGLLLLIRDFRLLAVLPVVAALFIALAPAPLTERLYSMLPMTQTRSGTATEIASGESNRDRVAMIRSGLRMVKDHPITGLGPEMVSRVYPQYRDAEAVKQRAAHLHNVPIQIAAERGLPALGAWLWFVFMMLRDFIRKGRQSPLPSIAMTGLAAVVAMLAAGMFEYNFGDSEFLMLFLILVTLPYAADRTAGVDPAAARPAA